MNYLKLTRDKLSIETISDMVAHDSCGAISLFVGTTRDNFEEKKVLSLEYEAYEPMAVKQMEKMCDDVRKCWPDIVNIAVYHRLGLVPVKEASVVIAISSPHRKSSLDAVSFAIEELKKLVPIWKKEKYDGDESTWKENKESGRGDRLKRPKLDFSSCAVEEPAPIPKNLVQIAADENEIQRRIQCFVEKKREEIDLNNIMDYTAANHLPEVIGDDLDEKESTCARTNSVIVKQEDSKCHLRVRRVKNRMGPQIRPDYLQTLDKLMSAKNTPAIKIKQEPTDNDQENFNSSHGQEISSALQQRLSNVEEYLHLRVINTKHVYERIKAIENRILHLESISPEYKHFFTDKFSSSRQFTTPTDDKILAKRKVYSVDELDSIIEQMKQNDSDREEEKYPLLDET